MQNSILIMIDLEATLAARSIVDNYYLIDNTRGIGSKNVGQHDLVTIIRGTRNPDGKVADAVVMNWLAGGISSAPHTLPKSYFAPFSGTHRYKRLLAAVRAAETPEHLAKLASDHTLAHHGGGLTTVLAHDGKRREIEATPTDATGRALNTEEQLASAALTPVIVDIRGPAVTDGVLFPSQYGSPDLPTEGWYWSASVDTSKIGEHIYTVVVMIYRPQREGEAIVWHPEFYNFDARIDVTEDVVFNGFTGYGPGILPLVPGPCVPAGDAPQDEPEAGLSQGDIL